MNEQQRKQQKATDILLTIAREQKTGNTTTIRHTPTERMWLSKLAQVYSMPMAEVHRRLLQQAIIDYVEAGEVLALLKY